jgi:hypothetical protein
VDRDPAFDSGHTEHSQHLARVERERRFYKLVREMLDAASAEHTQKGAEPDSVWQTLLPIARLDEEAPQGGVRWHGISHETTDRTECDACRCEAGQERLKAH